MNHNNSNNKNDNSHHNNNYILLINLFITLVIFDLIPNIINLLNQLLYYQYM